MTISKFEPYNSIFELLHDVYDKNISIYDCNDFFKYLGEINYNDEQFLIDYLNIIKTLHKHNIISYDFLNLGNIGYIPNTNKLIYFDIGYGKFDKPDWNVKIDKFYFEDEKELFGLLGIKNKIEIGSGGNGTAYQFQSNKILKITIDTTEVYNSYNLLMKEIPNLVYIHNVYEYTIMNMETKWCIIQDKCDSSEKQKSDIKQRYSALNTKFLKFKQK